MRTIGITGRSGCGKSTVSAHYRALGYRVADADLVARQVLEPGSACIPLLVEQFGADILDEAGGIQRRLLADRAFARPDGSQRLVSITHPEIVRRLLQESEEARQAGQDVFFVDGAVIVGAPFELYCDGIILVSAPLEESVRRICARDGISEESARRRLDAQLSEETLRAACAWEIRNDSTLTGLLEQADRVLEHLKGGM
nr:dephospho-CoA kinase [Fournierella massiliensis]